MKTAAVIGSGLGGLECGLLLAKQGWKVTVLEQAAQAGGCMQNFSRKGHVFDTGLHHVGLMEDGGMLRVFFYILGISDLKWVQADPLCQDEVHIGKKVYRIPSGSDRLENYLCGLFPENREGISKLIRDIREVSDKDRSISALQYLRDLFGEGELFTLLTYSSPRLEISESLSFYEYAHIIGSFMDGCWRLKGGSAQIVRKLTSQIEALGGSVRTNARVTGLEVSEGKVESLEINGTEKVSTDMVVSDIHPSVLMNMLEGGKVRKIYRERISSLENGCGIVTLNIVLKKGRIPYRNSNIFIRRDSREQSTMICLGIPEDGRFSETADILYTVPAGTVCDKAEIEKNCLALAGTVIEGFEEAVDAVYISTPATYERYTSTVSGSAYGIRKDWRETLKCSISPLTPLSNLFLTGQNINLHGVVGVTASAFATIETIKENIHL